VVLGCALAFAAGVFLCIALADLLPEVAFHTHDRLQLTVSLLLGIALAWSIGLFEPQHSHSHDEREHSGHVHGR
jgi:zinc and cadmium transporter